MRFPLSAWRRPALDDRGVVVPFGGIGLIVGMSFAALHDLFDIELVPAIAIAAAGTAASAAAAFALGHPKQKEGHVTLLAGQIEIDLGRSKPICAPVSAIYRAFLQSEDRRPEETELLIEITGQGWRRIRVERLGGRLDDLLVELHAQIAAHADLPVFLARTNERVASLNKVHLAVLVLGLIAAFASVISQL